MSNNFMSYENANTILSAYASAIKSGGGGGGVSTKSMLYYLTDSDQYAGYFVRVTGLLSQHSYVTELNAQGNGYVEVDGMEHYTLEFFYLDTDENDEEIEVVIWSIEFEANMGCFYYIRLGYDTRTFRGIQMILNDHKETEHLAIGDTIRTTLASQEVVDFQIAAINHNNEALHSVIWVAKNTLLDPKVHNSVGQTYMQWRTSAVRSFLNNTFYNSLQDDIKPYVKERTTMTAINGGSSGLNTDVDKVWIPRVYEAYGSGGPAQEHSSGGAELFPIFTSGANRQKCVGISGTVPVKWLLSSPSPNKYSSTSYYPWSYEMDTNGVYDTYGNNYAGSEYVVPCWLQVADE